MAEPLLRVENLWRRFDVSKPWLNRVIEREDRQFLTAVADVSFEIAKGETFALVGESGSGKSTIAKMIVGAVGASEGTSCSTAGHDDDGAGADLRALRRRFQMIFQDPYASLNPRWRVGDIIAEPMRTFGIASGRRPRARWGGCWTSWACRRGCREVPARILGRPAPAHRDRARAVVRPEFIVCDEPTSALDVSVQAQILNLMRDCRMNWA
jgi:ABC-type glutathione transport system ATPase component